MRHSSVYDALSGVVMTKVHNVRPKKPDGFTVPVRFGSDQTASVGPLEAYVAKNQIVNRTIIETIGYTFWAILFARNNYERAERSLDWLMWTSVGGLLLPFLGKKMNDRGLTELKKMGVSHPKALEIPLEQLEHFALKNPENRAALVRQLGLKSAEHLPQVVNKIVRNKLLLVGMNLFLLAAKGQAFYWGKNLFTEYLSGRKGFVGEFNIADKAYTQQKATEADKSKRFRQIVSVVAGLAAVIAAPLWIYTLLNSQAKRGPLAFFKKLLPYYNYKDAIHLGKAVLIFHNVFNWFLPSVLSARDNHERREVLFKNVVFDLFYFLGDMAIASGVAAGLQRLTRFKQQLGSYSMMTEGKNWLGLKLAKDYSLVCHEVEENLAPKIALKLARINFWSGILGTSLCLGVATTLLNNWYTRQKVLQEQQHALTFRNPLDVPSIQSLFRSVAWG